MASRYVIGLTISTVLFVSGCAEIRRVDENHVLIRGQLFELRPVVDSFRTDPLFGEIAISTEREVAEGFEFERMIVQEIQTRGEPLEEILKQALQEIGLDTNRVVFFPASLGKMPVTLHLRNVTVADLVRYVSDLANADIVRQTDFRGDPPRTQGMFILRAPIYAEQMSRAFVAHEGATAEGAAAFVSLLAEFDPTMIYEFQRERSILILHGRRDVVDIAERF